MKNQNSAGFSYIEVMVALVILMIGLLGLLSGLTAGVVRSRSQEEQMMAKHIAASTLESIMSLKETDPENFGWLAVGNVGRNPDAGGVNRGVFVTGEQDVHLNPGPDNLLGTADDNGPVVDGVTRQVTIVDECDPDRPSPAPLCNPAGINPVRVRSVIVVVRYLANSIRQTETLRTVLTDYAKPADPEPTPTP